MSENELLEIELKHPMVGAGSPTIPSINTTDEMRLYMDVWKSICEAALRYIPQKYEKINGKTVFYNDAVAFLDLKIIALEFELAKQLSLLESKEPFESFSQKNTNLMEHLFLEGDLNDSLFFSDDNGTHKKYTADQKTNHAILNLFKSYERLDDAESKALYADLFNLIRDLDSKDFADFYKTGSIKNEDANFDSKENIIRFKRIFLKRKSLFLANFETLVFINGEEQNGSVLTRLAEPQGGKFFSSLKQYLLNQDDFAMFILQDKVKAFLSKKSDNLRSTTPILKASPVLKSSSKTSYSDFKGFKKELEAVNSQLNIQIKSLRDIKDVDDDFIKQYNSLESEQNILKRIVTEKQKDLTLVGSIKNDISEYGKTVKGRAGSTALAGAKSLMLKSSTYMGFALYNKFKGEDYKNDWEEITKQFSMDLLEAGGGVLLSIFIGPSGFGVVSSVFGMFKEKQPTQLDKMERRLTEITNKLDDIAKSMDRFTVTLPEVMVQTAKIAAAKKAITEMINHLTNIKNIYNDVFRNGNYHLDVDKLWQEHEAFKSNFQLFMKEFWDSNYAFTTGDGFVFEGQSRDTSSLSYGIINAYKDTNTYLRFDQTFKKLFELVNAVESLIAQYRDIRVDLLSLLCVSLPLFNDSSRNKSKVLNKLFDLTKNEADLNAVLMYSLITLRKNVLGERNQRLYDKMMSYWENHERFDYFNAFFLKDQEAKSFYMYDYANKKLDSVGNYDYRFFIVPDAGTEKANQKYKLINSQLDDHRKTFEYRIAMGHDDTLIINDNLITKTEFADNIDGTIEHWIKKTGGVQRLIECNNCFELFITRGDTSPSIQFYLRDGKYGLEEQGNIWGYQLISGEIENDFKGQQPCAIAGFDKETKDFYIGFGVLKKDDKGNETVEKINTIAFDKHARVRTDGNTSAFDYRFSNDAIKNRFEELHAKYPKLAFNRMSSVRFDNLKLLINKDTMLRGQALIPGDSLIHYRHKTILIMQSDGNLVLYSYEQNWFVEFIEKFSFITKYLPTFPFPSNRHIWFASHTNSSGQCVLHFQRDGNLVIYPEKGPYDSTHAKWSTNKREGIWQDYVKIHRIAIVETQELENNNRVHSIDLDFFDENENKFFSLVKGKK